MANAVRAIAQFWEGPPLPWAGGRVSHVERLAQEFGCALPGELSEYVSDFVPIRHFELRQLGNPIVVYGLEGDRRLGFEQPGYNKHGLTGESLEGWERAWFLLADQGGGPIIVDLSRRDTQVGQAMHGAGAWYFQPIADTIGQFVVCAAALQHTIVKWRDELVDDGLGLRLPPEAASWYFPRMREWSGDHYARWREDFTNAE
jgi:hypothetical protein